VSADFGIASMKMVGSLIFVTFLIIGLFYLLKRLRWHSSNGNRNIQMRLLSLLPLAPKRSIALVQIRDQWLVVGVGTESVTLITKVDPPTDSCDAEVESTAGKKNFHTILQNISLWSRSPMMRSDEKAE
jgi:flagellar biosynthetic protein FliO